MKSGTHSVIRAALVLLFVTGMAKPASADWLFTPYLGINFSGAANTVDLDDFDEAFEQRVNFGGSLAGMSSGIFGFEVDFNYTPNFFQVTEGGEDFELLERRFEPDHADGQPGDRASPSAAPRAAACVPTSPAAPG